MDFPSVRPWHAQQIAFIRVPGNIVQLSNAKKSFSNFKFLTINAVRRTSQKLIKLVDLNRVRSALMQLYDKLKCIDSCIT